jgi:hypothetical protein
VEGYTEIPAKSGELEIGRKWLVLVLVKMPHRSLERAEDLVAGRKEGVKPLVPRLKKGAIESGVVGGELSNVIGSSIRSEHGNRGVATKEFGELLCDFLGLMRLSGPETSAVMILSKAISVGLTLVKSYFCFKHFDGFKVVIDGYSGKLNDRVSLRVQATTLDVEEDNFLGSV